MSTTFALFKEKPELNEDGQAIVPDDPKNIVMVTVAVRNNTGDIILSSFIEAVFDKLPNDVEIYPIDNSPQGIYSIGDLKNKLYGKS